MKIGGLELEGPVCLAPLAGVTTLPVREFFSGLGASLTHTEMISCAGLVRDNPKTRDMLKLSENEAPLVVQLFAPDEALIAGGAEAVMKSGYKYSGLGINMACPMPKITKHGSGSALLRKPGTASLMVKVLSEFGLPVWVKIRRLENHNDTLSFIDALVSSGADNVCIHGRTPSQRYEGLADRSIIREASLRFPGYISASGDVRSTSDIDEYLGMGCAAVMAARGALSNPFMFEEYRGIFRTHDEKLKSLIEFSGRAFELAGEHRALVMMKRFAGGMLRYSRGSAELRGLAMQAVSLEDLVNILKRG